MTPLVFIDGDQGTTGLQIVERLRDRQDLRLLTLPAAQRKDPQRRAEALNRCDVAVLCLPDDAARDAVSWIENPAVRVIDASSAHRIAPGLDLRLCRAVAGPGGPHRHAPGASATRAATPPARWR
jgi:N-acetyl-gamma-glutamyl-phosphate reductase